MGQRCFDAVRAHDAPLIGARGTDFLTRWVRLAADERIGLARAIALVHTTAVGYAAITGTGTMVAVAAGASFAA